MSVEQCIATAKTSGARCKRTAIPGGTVCRYHGGSAPQVRRSAERRLARDRAYGEAGRLMELMGESTAESADPLSTLLEAVARSRMMARAFEVLVAELDTANRIEVSEDEDGGRYIKPGVLALTHLGDLTTHPYVEQLRTWTVEAARISKLALDAGVEERKVQLAEEQGNLLGQVLRGFVEGLVEELAAAGLDATTVRTVVAERAPVLMRRAVAMARAGDGRAIEASSS